MSPSSPAVDYFTFDHVEFEVSFRKVKKSMGLVGPVDLELKAFKGLWNCLGQTFIPELQIRASISIDRDY